MFTALRPSASRSLRSFSTSASASRHVALLGAAGGIGQPTALLLKQSGLVSRLGVYDIRGAPGVAADLSHVNTQAVVKGYGPEDDGLAACLKGAEIVLIPAGVPRKPGMTRDDLFNTNASIVRDLTAAIAKHAPKALIAIVSNPVNSTVPIAAQTLKTAGVYDPARLFGVTTLDVLRAQTFLAAHTGQDPKQTEVTVVGGHAGTTIIPLFSQVPHASSVTGKTYDDLVHRVQFGGDEVVKAKDGAGSATLSMAAAAVRFTEKLIQGLNGAKDVVTPAYVESSLFADQGVPFFASNVQLGPNGVQKVHALGELSSKEQEMVDAALPDLKKQIEKGIQFASS